MKLDGQIFVFSDRLMEKEASNLPEVRTDCLLHSCSVYPVQTRVSDERASCAATHLADPK